MKLKKLLAAAFAGIIAVGSLAGCAGGGSASSGGASSGGGDTVKIGYVNLVYDILINCTFYKSYDIIQTRQSEGPLYEIHA
jgi:hypothetical protein